MHKQIIGLAAAALILALISTAQAAVHEPYVPDLSFGTSGVVSDPLVKFVAQDPTRASGERVIIGRDGTTVVAGMGQMWSMVSSEWVKYLVVVRYGPDGQPQVWSNPTVGYSDASHTYLYLPPGSTPQAPDHARITAVQDIKIGLYGDIYVLIDALESGTAGTTDSLIVAFGADGEYKTTVTHMATPGKDDAGAALIPWGIYMYVVSSAGETVNLARYVIHGDGLPLLDTELFGSGGRASQTLGKCQQYSSQLGAYIHVPCQLRARRAVQAYVDQNSSPIYVAGEYMNFQGTGSAQSDLFIMRFDYEDGSSSGPYPVTWDSPTLEDGLRGLAYRDAINPPQRPQNELYLLDAFPRACRSGFIVGRFNADTGAFMDRTWTSGGGSDSDPAVCGTTISLEATDMILPSDRPQYYDDPIHHRRSRYLAIVGSRFSGEPYTGMDAFMSLVDTQDMHATPQVQTFTQNAGQFPDDAGFNAVTNDFEAGTITATGWRTNNDLGFSEALTVRMHPAEHIFTSGFDLH